MFELDRVPGSRKPLALRALLGGLRDHLLRLPLPLGNGLLALGVGLCLALGFLPFTLDLHLALLRSDLVLQTLALDLVLRLVRLEGGLGFSLPRLGRLAAGIRLGVDLSLLKAALTGQLVVADSRPRGFLRLARDLADEPAGGLLRFLGAGARNVASCRVCSTFSCALPRSSSACCCPLSLAVSAALWAASCATCLPRSSASWPVSLARSFIWSAIGPIFSSSTRVEGISLPATKPTATEPSASPIGFCWATPTACFAPSFI